VKPLVTVTPAGALQARCHHASGGWVLVLEDDGCAVRVDLSGQSAETLVAVCSGLRAVAEVIGADSGWPDAADVVRRIPPPPYAGGAA
jgi:hypothetical protein